MPCNGAECGALVIRAVPNVWVPCAAGNTSTCRCIFQGNKTALSIEDYQGTSRNPRGHVSRTKKALGTPVRCSGLRKISGPFLQTKRPWVGLLDVQGFKKKGLFFQNNRNNLENASQSFRASNKPGGISFPTLTRVEVMRTKVYLENHWYQ